ncbi:MAG TPA: nicotinate-nucleotide adenylyltransferase [Thermoleophilaceae bacterium]|nr:nicotinate-nucleotide adenylyltransferase [Thermoleophilaceae bacterium]
MRLGILGGAFNPPHIGHLVCAQEAVLSLDLERLLFVPMGVAPHREIEQDPGPEARFEMCELAVEDDERFEVSRVELDREGPSYTSETLRTLAGEGELFLVLGGDQAASLPTWHEPEEVLRLATVAVVPRTGFHRETIAVKIASVKGAAGVRFFDMPRIDVSSSLVRHRVAQGLPIKHLVPDKVIGYIEHNGLYGASKPATTA